MARARQDIITLPVNPTLRQKLVNAGVATLEDLEGLGPLKIADDLRLSRDEAFEIYQLVTSKRADNWNSAGAKSAEEIYHKEGAQARIVTFCSALDTILGGGVAPGHISEFCGVPGVGKTQLGMQLAVDVQIPALFGGLEGAAIYIDTEGSFHVERLVDIASAAAKHVSLLAEANKVAFDPSTYSVQSILSNIFYFRLHDYAEQIALLQLLGDFLQSQPQVRLIVVDSITFHFRQDFKDMGHRTRVLAKMAQDFMLLAEKHDLAVVFMNQVTTKVAQAQQSKLVPALGESWGHAASTRVILYWQDGERLACLYKSPYLPPATAQFLVTPEGIRGRPPAKRPAEQPLERGRPAAAARPGA